MPWGYAKMVYISVTDRVFVSYGGATWTYDYDANRWTDLGLSIKPSTRSGHGLAYDSESKAVVLFGGYSFNQETWQYE